VPRRSWLDAPQDAGDPRFALRHALRAGADARAAPAEARQGHRDPHLLPRGAGDRPPATPGERHRRSRRRRARGPHMTTPRIVPLDPPYPADLQSDFDKLMRGAPPLLLFRTMARNPRVLSRMMAGGL